LKTAVNVDEPREKASEVGSEIEVAKSSAALGSFHTPGPNEGTCMPDPGHIRPACLATDEVTPGSTLGSDGGLSSSPTASPA